MTIQSACGVIAALAHNESSGSGDSDADTQMRLKTFVLPFQIAANAGTSAPSFASFGPLPYKLRMVGAKILPGIAVAEDDTNYVTVVVGSDDGAAGTPTALQTVTTKKAASGGTGSWVAGTAIALSSIDSADTVASGAYLIVKLTPATATSPAMFGNVSIRAYAES